MMDVFILTDIAQKTNPSMACHKAIMGVKITNPNDRPLLDIKYPKGYEG